MKKLLALVLILAMASAASASIVVITVNGEDYTGQDVEGSDVIQIILMDTVNTQLQNINPGTTISVDNADTYSHTFATGGMFPSSVFTVEGDGYTWAGNVGYMFVAMPADDIVFVNEFHVPDGLEFSTEINIEWTISYMTDEPMPYSGSAILHVVPEPMTIALLGLGGLFLRRRRS